jgi:hypothetical protein
MWISLSLMRVQRRVIRYFRIQSADRSAVVISRAGFRQGATPKRGMAKCGAAGQNASPKSMRLCAKDIEKRDIPNSTSRSKKKNFV